MEEEHRQRLSGQVVPGGKAGRLQVGSAGNRRIRARVAGATPLIEWSRREGRTSDLPMTNESPRMEWKASPTLLKTGRLLLPINPINCAKIHLFLRLVTLWCGSKVGLPGIHRSGRVAQKARLAARGSAGWRPPNPAAPPRTKASLVRSPGPAVIRQQSRGMAPPWSGMTQSYEALPLLQLRIRSSREARVRSSRGLHLHLAALTPSPPGTSWGAEPLLLW